MLRVMSVLQGLSLKPEDQYVNTWHIDGPYTQDGAEQIAERIQNFWALSSGPTSKALGRYLSAFVSNLITVKVYDLDHPKPREPLEVQVYKPSSDGIGDLPEEVALCITWQGAPPVTNRRRGRSYLGPWSTEALGGDPVAGGLGPSRPNDSLVEAICLSSYRLVTQLAQDGTPLHIQSTVPSLNYVEVVSGFCNNGWDTQRRRGTDPTQRHVFPPIPG